ncbi:hypothetical protein [Paenibacillus contaminans]|uniref:hypothetical protein n=1 Tax=Paenibacillus contaminans TaxID=450362 RepID=UPI001864A14D|nr:hypothetical protein [Paenibacillus contaminans]
MNKSDFKALLAKSYDRDASRRVLVPNGIMYLGLYGGYDSEGVWEEDWCEPKRFFSFYSDTSIQEIVTSYFKLESFRTISKGEGNLHFQSILLRKG